MSLYKRKNVWWIDVTHNHQRIQRSTGTSNKQEAKQFHDQFKADLWKLEHLKEKPERTWPEAVKRWLDESSHKRSLDDDKSHLKWLDPYFAHLSLKQITRDMIDHVAAVRAKTHRKKGKKGARIAPATVNRMLAVIRAILRKAAREWDWLDKEPVIKLRKEGNHRVRWLKPEEAAKLIACITQASSGHD